MTSLERISCLVDHDICNSSVPAAWMMVVMVSGVTTHSGSVQGRQAVNAASCLH